MFTPFGVNIFHQNMINWQPQNRLQAYYTERARKLIMLFGVFGTCLVLSMVLVKPGRAEAATIYSQLDHSVTGANITAGAGISTPLGQITGTVDFISVRAINTLGSSNTIEVSLLCYDDAGYTTPNTGCSWNSPSNRDGTVGRFTASSNSDVEFTVFPTVDFTLSPTKYYRLGMQCISGCTPGVTETHPRMNADSSSFYYILDGTAGPSMDLTVNSTAPYVTNRNIEFYAEWDNQTISPRYLYFYSDAEETNPTVVVQNYPLGNSSNWTFNYSYEFDGTYSPIFAIGNEFCTTVDSTGTPIGSGCLYEFSSIDESLTLVSEQTLANNESFLFQSEFTASKTIDVIVDEVVGVTYDLSTNFCTVYGATVSGMRLFKGYPAALAYLDPGDILAPGLSGNDIIIFDRTAAPYSDFFYPYIIVYCDDSTSHKVYLGGSILVNNAQSISVYYENDIRFALPSAWLHGGQYTQSGSTYVFKSDKSNYRPNEPVKLNYYFSDPPFSFTEILLYDNPGGNLLKTLTGAAITEDSNHYLTISYSVIGEYQPLLVLSGSSMTRDVFLGGTPYSTPLDSWIVVTQQGSPLYVNTGAILGQYGGTGGTINQSGIFALDFSIGWGNTGNTFLDTVQGILSPVVWAALYISQKLYVIFSYFPVFDLVFDIVNPQNNSCYVTPEFLFDFPGTQSDIPLPVALAGRDFCVTLTTHSNAQAFTVILRVLIIFAVIFAFLRTFLPSD